MDSGYLAPGETLDDHYDVGRDLLPQEVLGIMDQILCYEMAWHQGYPLSQTLFTSHYLANLLSPARSQGVIPYFPRSSAENAKEPCNMVQLVLRAFCIGVIKSCDMTIELVISQKYYEEEDLATNTYNINLLTHVPDDQAMELLDHAVTWLMSSNEGRKSYFNFTTSSLNVNRGHHGISHWGNFNPS